MEEYDIRKAPQLVWYVKFAASSGIPIGLSTYREALEKHPEYFSGKKITFID